MISLPDVSLPRHGPVRDTMKRSFGREIWGVWYLVVTPVGGCEPFGGSFKTIPPLANHSHAPSRYITQYLIQYEISNKDMSVLTNAHQSKSAIATSTRSSSDILNIACQTFPTYSNTNMMISLLVTNIYCM